MSITLKNIVKHSSVYSIANILSKGVGFLLIPVYTRYLTPSDYGMLEIISITGEVVIIFCGLGVGSAVMRAFLYDSDNRDQQKLGTTTAYTFIATLSVILFGCLIFLSKSISSLLFGDSKYFYWLTILFITGIIRANNIIPLQIYRAELKSVKYSLINLVRFTVIIICNIYFIVYRGLGITGVLYGSLIGSALVFVINVIYIRRFFLLNFSLSILRKMLRFGLPLVPAMLALWILSSLDRYFLLHYSNSHELGLYSVGFRFAFILSLIFRAPFDSNWPSIYFPLAKQSNAKEQFSRIFTYYLLVGLFLSLGIILFARPAIQIMTTPLFYDAYKVVPYLVLAVIFRGLSSCLGVGFGISGKTEFDAINVGATAIINIILNFLLIPTFGMKGAAWATMISFASMALISYKLSNKLYPVKYEINRIVKVVAAFGITLLIHYLTSFNSLVLEIIFDAGLCLSYIGLLFYFKFFNQSEIMWLRGQWQKRKLGFAALTLLRSK